MNEDFHYRILGLNKNATKSDLEKSYRILALRYHPDKNNDTNAIDQFKKIQQSYEYLKNIVKNDFVDTKNSVDDIFDSIYYEVFLNKKDTKVRINISFKESYTGCQKQIEIYDHKFCKNCEGTGGVSWIYCEKCLGKGYFYKDKSLSIQSSCIYCQGKGSLIQNKCKDCSGNGFIKGKKRIENVQIPPGLENNTQIRFSGKGEGGGDLYVVVGIKEDVCYKRNKENILFDIQVPYSLLILGGDFYYNFLGEDKMVKIKPGTKVNSKILVKNLGFQSLKNKTKGDLELVVNLKYPKKINEKYKKILKNLSELENE